MPAPTRNRQSPQPDRRLAWGRAGRCSGLWRKKGHAALRRDTTSPKLALSWQSLLLLSGPSLTSNQAEVAAGLGSQRAVGATNQRLSHSFSSTPQDRAQGLATFRSAATTSPGAPSLRLRSVVNDLRLAGRSLQRRTIPSKPLWNRLRRDPTPPTPSRSADCRFPHAEAAQAMREAGFTDVRISDHRSQLDSSNREEVTALEGSAMQTLSALVGELMAQSRLNSAWGRQSALGEGDLIPGHLFGSAPI